MKPITLSRLIGALIIVGLYFLPSLITSQYYMHLIATAGIYVILVVGYNILYGMTGQLWFGHAGFFAIGAYAAGVATVQMHLPVVVGLAMAVALSILFGIIVGVPTLRLKGHYLAVATIAFGEIVSQVISNWKPVTRGFDGIVSIPGITIGNIEFKGDFSMYYVILTVALLGMLVSESIKHSTYGRILFAINDSEIAAEVMGVDTTRSKVIAFALSSVYAGVAGALYSHLFGYISPDAFDFRASRWRSWPCCWSGVRDRPSARRSARSWSPSCPRSCGSRALLHGDLRFYFPADPGFYPGWSRQRVSLFGALGGGDRPPAESNRNSDSSETSLKQTCGQTFALRYRRANPVRSCFDTSA